MILHFKHIFPQLNFYWDKYLPFQQRKEVPAKYILLEEGKVSRHYIFIEKGCVRSFFNNHGVDKTIQFHFEQEGLSSFESFINQTPSSVSIETIEPSTIYLLPEKYVKEMMEELKQESDFLSMLLQVFAKRQVHYINEFVSFIRDTPEQRYLRLAEERPHIIQRVPQHYIASYLGVSSVHLSRIKGKISKGKTHF